MVEVFHWPDSAALEALAEEGAARLASIDPRLVTLQLSTEGGAGTAVDGIVAHLELLLPEHQLILNRSDPHDMTAAVHDAFDAAAVSLREIARRDRAQPAGVSPG